MDLRDGLCSTEKHGKGREKVAVCWVSKYPPMAVGLECLMEEGEKKIGAGVGRMLR